MNDSIKELLKFVQIGARLDLKAVAVENILGLTGTPDGISAILEQPTLLVSLIALFDDSSHPVAKDASLCLVNISASNEKSAEILINLDMEKYSPPLQTPPSNLIKTLLRFITDETSRLADPCCMILSNLTRTSHVNQQIIEQIIQTGHTFDELIDIFTRKQFNKTGAKLHYLGPFLSNLSQSHQVRKFILDREKGIVQRLLPFTEYKDSLIRRGGVVGTLKNCCFEQDDHEWLLSDEVDILARLLHPLAGSEEFDEEDNDKLPLDLQYLPEDKAREEDPDIRTTLLEAITQLCTLRKNREFIRDKNAYIILRELHKWETDRKALLACENLVDILIRTEEEIGRDNLQEVQVPSDIADKFVRDDEEFIKENAEY